MAIIRRASLSAVGRLIGALALLGACTGTATQNDAGPSAGDSSGDGLAGSGGLAEGKGSTSVQPAGTGGTTAATEQGSLALEAVLLETCRNWQANGLVLACSVAFSLGYVDDCVAGLMRASTSCGPEVSALTDCGAMRPALDYECTAEGDIAFVDGVCEGELDALETCQNQPAS